MNKTYRIKYNQHTGAYVAVAEISTARGKSGGSSRLVAAALLAAGLGISSTAAGAIPWGDGQDISWNSNVTEGVALGPYMCNNAATSQTVYDANGNPFAKSYPANSGHEGAWLEGNRGVVLGGGCDNVAVAMQDAVAIGNGAAASVNAVAIGNMALAQGSNAISIGTYAQASNVKSIAIGANTVASGAYSIAQGHAANAAVENSVAIGNGAVASATNSISLGLGAGASVLPMPMMPLGNNNNIGTYAGNASMQMNSNLIGNQAGLASAGLENNYIGSNSGAGMNGANNVAIGKMAGTEVVAVFNAGTAGAMLQLRSGSFVPVFLPGIVGDVNQTVSIGDLSLSRSNSGVALGSNAIVEAGITGSMALGAGSRANALNSLALGAGSETSRANTVSVGKTGAERQITNVADGTTLTDAVNLKQLQAVQALIGTGSGGTQSSVNFFSVNGNSTDGNFGNDGASGLNAIVESTCQCNTSS